MEANEERPKRPRNANREALLILSNDAKSLRDKWAQDAQNPEESFYWASRTLNFIMLKYFYKVPEGMELGTFHQWKAKGCMIKKGEKALTIWGQPIHSQRLEKAKAKGEPAPEEDESEYFPMCFLFRADQVLTAEELEAEKAAKAEVRAKKEEIKEAIADFQLINFDDL
jgi:hypothetical protein